MTQKTNTYDLLHKFEEQGQLDQELSALEADLLRTPDDVDTLNSLGYSLYLVGRLQESESIYRKALSIAPHDGRLHLGLGCILEEQDFGKAVYEYGKAFQLGPVDDETFWNDLGIALAGIGRTDDAAEAYRMSVQVNPDYADPHYNLGLLLLQIDHLTEAALEFRETVRLSPENMNGWIQLIDTLLSLGKFHEAADASREGLRIAPDCAALHNGYGIALGELGCPEEAAAEYAEAVRLDQQPYQSQ